MATPKTRNAFKNHVNKLLDFHTKGFFTDDFWQPVHATFKELDAQGIEYELTGARYEHDANNTPCRKVWTFEVQAPKGKPLYGVITAAGAGTVEDPLARYDVTAYVV